MVCVSLQAKYLEQANTALQDGNSKDAITLYRKAALNGENPVLSYFNMGNAYFQMDSLPQSIIYYRAALGYAPEFFRAWLNLSTAYYRLNDMGQCIASIRRAIALDPESAQALFILGTAYRNMSAHAEAITTYEKLIYKHSDYAEAYIAMGELYSDLEDYETSLHWLNQYPEDGNSDGYIHVLKSEIARKTGDESRELYFLRKAFEADKSNKWILYRIVESLIESDNKLVALEEIEKGLDYFPQFAELAILGGNIAFQLENLNQAERLYMKARNNGNPNAVIGLENIRVMRMQMAMK